MQTGLHLHVILLLWTLSLSSCSVSCLALQVGFLHVSTCESRGRRSWVAGGATKCIRSVVVSSSADDEVDSSDADIDNDRGPMPLFPELANPSPLPPPQSYDDAVDALQNRRRGSPFSSAGGQSSERALSTSEEIRNALDGDGGGGLAAAAMAIRKAMSPGGEWYDPDADENGDEDADGEEENTSNNILDFLLEEDADTNMDRAVQMGSSSQLTNLDFLLGKLGERSNDES